MFLAQIANTPQLPELPEGPSLESVRGPVEIPAFETWQIALAGIALILLLGLVAWCLKKFCKPKPKSISPYETAMTGLNAATDQAQQDNERFAVLCSQVLRRYLEDGLGLKFSARTSEEFLRSLKGNTSLEESYQEELTDLLAAFDRIKFARKEISQEERSDISDTVRSLIERAEETIKEKGRET